MILCKNKSVNCRDFNLTLRCKVPQRKMLRTVAPWQYYINSNDSIHVVTSVDKYPYSSRDNLLHVGPTIPNLQGTF